MAAPIHPCPDSIADERGSAVLSVRGRSAAVRTRIVFDASNIRWPTESSRIREILRGIGRNESPSRRGTRARSPSEYNLPASTHANDVRAHHIGRGRDASCQRAGQTVSRRSMALWGINLQA